MTLEIFGESAILSAVTMNSHINIDLLQNKDKNLTMCSGFKKFWIYSKVDHQKALHLCTLPISVSMNGPSATRPNIETWRSIVVANTGNIRSKRFK